MIAKTANALKAMIQENDRVAIYSENSAEWITFDLAILSLVLLPFLFTLRIMPSRPNILSTTHNPK
jgi:long-subunit acyl-CoA synthetase (AMP-forming)